MGLSAGPAGGLPGMSLKAWGLVNTNTGTVVKGFNVASVAGSNVTFSAPMASTNYAVRVLSMLNQAVVTAGVPSSASVVTVGAYAVATGTPQTGLMYFEVYE
jgi:hypothetical protein